MCIRDRNSSVSVNAAAFTDLYGEASSWDSVITRKMYRAVTRGENLDAWWSFDRDNPSHNEVFSDAGDGQMATLYDSKITPAGRFGNGLAFDRSKKDGRMKVEPNGIDLNGNGWSVSLWCKNILPPAQGGKTTLLRGQDKQLDFEFDHYLSYRAIDRNLGFIDGDQEQESLRFLSSSYSLDLSLIHI